MILIPHSMEPVNYYRGRAKTYYEIATTVAMRNVKLRYKNSLLGFIWSLLNPLIYLLIFIVIFREVFEIDNYPLFILSALVFWTFFSGSSIQILSSILDSGGILKSLSVPPIIFPLSYLLSSLVNLSLMLVPFFILMLFFGFTPSWITLLIIPGIFFLSLFTFGFSLILCAFNVFFRDVSMFYNTILPALFYMTPIAYPISQVSEELQIILKLNPIFHYIVYFRDILYYNQIPDITTTYLTIGLGVVFSTLGIYVFNSLKKGFISHL